MPDFILSSKKKTVVLAVKSDELTIMIKTVGMPWQFLRQMGEYRQYIDTQIYFSLMNKQVSRPAKLAIIGGSAVYLLLIADGCDTQRLSPYASGSLWIKMQTTSLSDTRKIWPALIIFYWCSLCVCWAS